MISRLPKWVELGAFFLAVLAGSVNAIGLLGFQHQAVSHLSGTATLLGADLIQGNSDILHLAFVLLSFIVGSALSGVLVGNTALKLGRNYSFALILEGALLFAAMVMLMKGSLSGHYLASAACGLQNALVTTYSGALIRTTHVTGLFTDIGIMLGMKLRGHVLDRRRLGLYCLIIGGFIGGGALGSLLYLEISFMALVVPGSMAILLALAYGVYVKINGRYGESLG
ncbi:MAG: DUF1275 domain-containing protein [Gammaproteobacteria bacterium]|nr:DUF1275 domain-containing protein [Gammaproteobacteria bacterium]MBQ0775507.1 DUF1275 domain-containing protein [Gammaproteobacteria bacterium]